MRCVMRLRTAAAANSTTWSSLLSTVSKKNDTDVAHYNFKMHQPILVIFGRSVAE